MSLTETMIKRPSLVVVIFAVLGVLGIWSYQYLKYELLPKMTPPVISIITVYPGASPSEVENSVTRKIEDAVSSLEKIKTLRGNSNEGMSMVIIEFDQSANINDLLAEAQRKTQAIVNDLPEDAKMPTMVKFALDELPVLQLGATSNMDNKKFYQLVKDQIAPRLNKISGVGLLSLVGGEEREIRINVNEQKLRGYNMSILQVVQAVKSANLDFPTGNVKGADGQLIVRIAGKVPNVEALNDIIVGRSQTGSTISLKDVAEVQDGSKDPAKINRINNVTSIGIQIQKQTDANAVEVVKQLRVQLTKLETEYKDINLKFDIASDNTQYTIDAAHAVQEDLMLAIILVAVVMLVFLHSLRNSLIVMIAIPCSLVSTFLAMYLLDYSLNLMTLLALSLVIGILVDDSIVVIENIYRHLEMGKNPRQAAVDGRSEIGFTALSITLVDVVVFFPLALQTGIIGNIMREFSIVVVVSTLMSLFVSFTVTPVLASRFSRLEHLSNKSIFGQFGLWFERVFAYFTKNYTDLLAWCLGHWSRGLLVLGFVLASMFGVGQIMKAGLIGGEFINKADRGEFALQIELEAGATIRRTNEVTQEIENILLKMPEVKKVSVNVGAANDGFLNSSSSNISELTIALKPQKERPNNVPTAIVERKVREEMAKYPGIKAQVRSIGIFGKADEAPIQLALSGPNRDSLRVGAERVRKLVESLKGTTDIKFSSEDGKPELNVDIDKVKMAQFGLTVADVGTSLRTALTGYDNTKFRDGDNEFDIRIQLDEADRAKPETVRDLSFMTPTGRLVTLSQFATITQTSGPTKMERRDRLPSIMLNANVLGRASGDIGNEIEAALLPSKDGKTPAKVKLPRGVTFAWEGQIKNQKDSNSSMGLAFMVSILFVYLIMVALYDSYAYPFVVLFSIPLAVIGALIALAMSMSTMTIFSMLGFIMLIGLVAKNAILLVDFANHEKAKGKDVVEALVESGKERLRPILMTTLSMIIGMLPIALATGAGAEWKKGLAWALIGGLTSSMFLTLIVVPEVYLLMDRGIIPGFTKAFKGIAWLFGKIGSAISWMAGSDPDDTPPTPPQHGKPVETNPAVTVTVPVVQTTKSSDDEIEAEKEPALL